MKKRIKILCAGLACFLLISIPVSASKLSLTPIANLIGTTLTNLQDTITLLLSRVPDDEYSALQKVMAIDHVDEEDEEQSDRIFPINKVILVGDERTAGMLSCAPDSPEVTWICQDGMGYSWFKNIVVPQLDSQVTGGTAVVFMLGLNDPENADLYIDTIESKAARWSEDGADVYIAGIGPTDTNDRITYEAIRSFNKKIEEGISCAGYIDVYQYLSENSYITTDGILYDESTSLKLYDYIIGKAKALVSKNSSGSNRWWGDSERENTYLTYSATNWAIFENLNNSLLVQAKVQALVPDELKAYEELMEAAANRYNFLPYKELFKAIAVYRHKKEDPDIFRIVDTGLYPYADILYPSITPTQIPEVTGTPTELEKDPSIRDGVLEKGEKKESRLTAEESIDIAAKLFQSCIIAAKYPNPSQPQELKALLQAFEFEADDFISYCDNAYTLEKSEEYAGIMCGETFRIDADMIDMYGKFDYHDQKFPDKVLKYYNTISIGNPNLSGDEKQLLTECMASWPANLSEGRRRVIEKGLSLYGKIIYSMDMRLQPSQLNPQYLDCSSFVGWSYHYAGFSNVNAWWCTDNFLYDGLFVSIRESELIPGDVALLGNYSGGSNQHIGIYLGKSATGQNVWLHCTGSTDRVTINTVDYWHYWMRYSGFTG